MARARITRLQWSALRRIGATSRMHPRFPAQPWPWGYHQTTWSSLERRGLITFSFRRGVCHVQLTPNGHLALRHPVPMR